MSWGLPPKYMVIQSFENIPFEDLHNTLKIALKKSGFEIESDTGYTINAIKKLNITFMSFMAFARPKITLLVLITKNGRLTIKSRYDYGSMHGIAMYDMGKQKNHIDPLLEVVKQLTQTNTNRNKTTTIKFLKKHKVDMVEENYYENNR